MIHALPGRASARWVLALAGALACVSVHATEAWTLETSIERALAVAPELEMRAAAIRAQQGAARQAGAWPNPTVEVRADNRLAREALGDGREVTSLAVSQPLPWGVRGARREAAARELAVREAAADAERLALERRVTEAYHRLQREQALLSLARTALDEARRLASPETRRLALGDISRREAMRAELFAAHAQVTLAETEGEWAEARLEFAALLALDPGTLGALAPLTPVAEIPALAALERTLDLHPALADAQAQQAVFEAGAALARAEARPALSVSVFRERDAFAGREETVSGGSLNIEIPLWDRKRGRRDEFTALAAGERSRALAMRRGLVATLRSTHEHLVHLIEQTRYQEGAVLAPALEVRTLTQRGYEAGELDLIDLIAATETAREAEAQRQRLLADTRLALAAVRHAAGLYLESGLPDTAPLAMETAP